MTNSNTVQNEILNAGEPNNLSAKMHRHHCPNMVELISGEVKEIKALLGRAQHGEEKPKYLIREAQIRLKEANEFLRFHRAHRLMVDEEDLLEGREIEHKLNEVQNQLQRQLEQQHGEAIEDGQVVADKLASETQNVESDQGHHAESFFQRMKHLSNKAKHTDDPDAVGGGPIFDLLKRRSHSARLGGPRAT